MPRIITALLCGLLFGAGLAISGMINPAKVLNFLDITGTWDPSLILVMASAVAVTAIGYRLAFTRSSPLFSDVFSLPTAADVDAKLLIGAAIFGVGWGLGGYCPGPALAGLYQGTQETIVFLTAMIAGLMVARSLANALASQRAQPGP